MKNLKIILIIPLFLMISLFVKGQIVNRKDYYGYRHQLKTGIGVAYHGLEDMTGYSVFSKYHYYLNKNISIATEFDVLNFRSDEKKLFRSMSAEALKANIQIYWLQRRNYSFFTGIGANIRLFHWMISNQHITSYTAFDEVILPNSHKAFTQFTGGYQFVVGLGYHITPLVGLELSTIYQNDVKGNAIWDIRMGFLVRF